ncbi:DUF2993 domain-containing protein [Streptomyces ficellus]|uniref:DUF2993 domain-containing protein n=1 Tax=Streptomyces ficellus TaxID=1977088 RepID=A0A6I6FPG2_9ACTN|nr:DUF2993 domain-containing protein [Streptomyces ficellus]QGV82272.1 DUF2993 domain-containing protein [Streptomyces ficellus]
MRPPTRIASHPHNPYEELAELADPEPDFTQPAASARRGSKGLGIRSDDDEEEWSPPNHRGRSRFAAVSVVFKLGVTAVVGAVLLVTGDRLAVAYAEEKAEDKIQQSLHLAARPQVDIAGFPFLTQVLDKRIRSVDVTVPDVAADKVSLAEVHATADDIRIVGDLPSSVEGAVVDRMNGDVLLSFDDLNRELGASHVRFSSAGGDGIRILGSLPVAGREVSVRAEAHVRRDGDRAVSTTVENMSLDVPGLFTYRPGDDPARSGLRLHPEAARRISREAADLKALLGVPAIAERLGLPRSEIDRALRGEKELSRLTGSPVFLQRLAKVNLVDLVIDHPWLLEKAGIDPALVGALLKLRPPQLADRFSLSFELPRSAGDLRLRDVTVDGAGIRVGLTGSGLAFGNAKGSADASAEGSGKTRRAAS